MVRSKGNIMLDQSGRGTKATVATGHDILGAQKAKIKGHGGHGCHEIPALVCMCLRW